MQTQQVESKEIVISKKYLSETFLAELSSISEKDLAFFLQLGKNIKDILVDQPQLITTVPSIIPSTIPPTIPRNTGKIGEDHVLSVLREKYSVENVATRGHMGDLLISRLGGGHQSMPGKVLVEIKNYSNTVPKREVDKFYDDLRTNHHILGGLFVSLRSDITGISDSFSFKLEYIDRNIPVVYITSSIPEAILLATEILWVHIDTRFLNLEENDKLQRKMDKVYSKVSNLSDLIGSLGSLRKSVEELNSYTGKSLRKLSEGILGVELRISMSIEDIRRMMNRVNMATDPKTSDSGILDDMLTEMSSVIQDKFPESKMAKKGEHWLIFERIFRLFLDETSIVKFTPGQKFSIILVEGGKDTKVAMLDLLKTKTNIKLNIFGTESTNENTIEIPRGISYDNGWISFSFENILNSEMLTNLEIYFQKLKKVPTISYHKDGECSKDSEGS